MTIVRQTTDPEIPPINTINNITMMVDGYDYRAIDDILKHGEWTGLDDQRRQLFDLHRRMVNALDRTDKRPCIYPRKLNA